MKVVTKISIWNDITIRILCPVKLKDSYNFNMCKEMQLFIDTIYHIKKEDYVCVRFAAV